MKIGITELIVVFVVALFVIGPDKLPAYAKKLGESLAQFRKYSEAATKDIKESIVEPLEEAQRPLREAVEPLQELDKEIRGDIKDVQDSFAGIGKPKKNASNKAETEAQAEVKAEEDTNEESEKETEEEIEIQETQEPQKQENKEEQA